MNRKKIIINQIFSYLEYQKGYQEVTVFLQIIINRILINNMKMNRI